MAWQIHGVMKEAQDLDHVTVRHPSDAEQNEMTTLAALAGDVKREIPFRMSSRFLAPTTVGPAVRSFSAAETVSA